MRQKWVYIILLVVTNVTVFYITPIMFSFNTNRLPFFYYLLRALLLVLALYLLPLVFADYIKMIENKLKAGTVSLVIVFLSLFYISEIFFTFYPETNGKNDTYCSKTWIFYYWKLNSNGFRDIEFRELPPNKPIIAFVGDSYTEGHGIKDTQNRVSNLCRKEFTGFNIYNLGKNGIDINVETNLIKNMPIHPQIIILQICSNDWDYLSNRIAIKQSTRKMLLANAGSFSLSNYSILLNYLNSKFDNIIHNVFSSNLNDEELNEVYHTFQIDLTKRIHSTNNLTVFEYAVTHSALPDDSMQSRFFEMFKEYDKPLKIMTDTVLFADYLNKLSDLKRICDNQHTELIIVPYPGMDKFSMKVGNRYVNRYLCNLISKKGLHCLDIYPALKEANLSTYTVNNSDNHINAKASKIVADTLITYLHKNILKM